MKRTQIYIDEGTLLHLQNESEIEHKTISVLIRESIKDKIHHKKYNIIKKMDIIFGLWEDRTDDVDDYIRNVRRDRTI